MEKDLFTRGKTICLCMIVKNESQVIDRALKSVLPYIDYWVICDTGSTDNTPAVILQHLYIVPGEIHHIEWVNFGYNRTKAIQLAQNKADYILVMDADMIVNVYGDFKQKLEYDFYEIRYEGEMDYTQPMLVSGKHKWEYIGVTHEYLNAPHEYSSDFLPELTLAHFGDGNNRSAKFERDIRLLESELEKEPGNRRTVFYLAQSYKDLGKWEAALKYYQERVNLGDGWEEELFFSMYQVGKMQQSLGYDWSVVEKSYLAAFSFRPHRLEPVYEVVKYYREKEAFALGYLYSSLVSYSLDYPHQDRLFIDRSVYTYKFLLEHAVCAYAQNKLAEAVETFNKIVDVDDLPQWAMDAAFRGRKMALDIIYNKQESNHPVFNKIKVLIPFYNPGCYFEKCIDSLLAQDYANFELIFLDDGSADGSHRKIPLADERVTLVRKKKNKGLGYNLHHLYRRYCDPTDIVVHVDADDYLAGPGALSYINRFYNEHDCWVMYGQYQYSGGAPGICKPFASPGDFLRLRLDWRTSHVRSFRAGLYHKIAETDPGYSCMKDARGQWFSSAADAAVMFPIVELAGFDRVRFNERVLYIYNEGNANSLTNKNRKAQLNSYLQIEAKRPFRPVDSYLPASVADKIKS